jgi:hypothetical protein
MELAVVLAELRDRRARRLEGRDPPTRLGHVVVAPPRPSERRDQRQHRDP